MDNKKIFISYSHKDKELKDQVVSHLNAIKLPIDIWVDKSEIDAGDEWEKKIKNAIEQSEMAILLISTDFLNSKFITEKVLPLVIRKNYLSNYRVIPFILKPSAWDEHESYKTLELAVRPKEKSFIEYSEINREKVLLDFAKEVNDYFIEKNIEIDLKYYYNLPQKNNNFVGRKQEVEKIIYGITHPKANFEYMITGMAGIGKTELLKHICYIVKDRSYFKDGILWINFEQDNLYDNIIDTLINNFIGKDILIVFDSCDANIEKFSNCYRAIHGKYPILAASRQELDIIHNKITLNNFNEEEAFQLLNLILLNTLTNTEMLLLKNLLNKIDFIPVFIELIASRINKVGVKRTISEIENKTNTHKEDKYLNINQEDKFLESVVNHQNTITQLNNDEINAKEDYLNISNDIDAFAKLISYKELKPPLSIALFGNWGSGKSTFMEMLENRIEIYTDLDHKDFCKSKSIVHVRFNAWHYSDTNLWASLVSHIFKELDKHINGKDKENRVSIYAKLLDSQKEKIEEKESQQDKIEKEIEKLKKSIEDIENKKLDKTKEIKEINLKDISKEILEDKDIKKELEDIKKEFVFIYGNDISEIKKTYNELNTTYSTYKKAIWLLYHNKKSRKYLGISIVVFIILSGLSYFYSDDIKSYISLLIAIVISGKVFLDIYIKKFSPITGVIEKFIKNYEDKELLLKDDEKIELEKEIAHKNLEIKEIKQQIQIEKNKKVEIEKEIEKIKSGEYLANFIADRSSSDDYAQHLGLVSVIREDFDKLKEQIVLLEKDAKFNIDRIVLYIDDLDRCADDKVVKVLEAIHLLLAFELFVVVVGVDYRWIRNSLVKECGLSENENDKSTNKATTYDYLEKIFQIPFKIKPLSKNNKTNLINKLLEGEIKEDNLETQEREKIENKNEINTLEQQSSKQNPLKNEIQSREPNSEDKPAIPPKIDKNKIEDSYEKMKFSKKEIEFMEDLVEYIGETPRTIKRFINIYRIIKNHQEIKNVLDRDEEYKLILVILCLVFTDIEYLLDESKGSNKLSSDILDIYKNSEEMKRKQYVEFILRFSFKD